MVLWMGYRDVSSQVQYYWQIYRVKREENYAACGLANESSNPCYKSSVRGYI